MQSGSSYTLNFPLNIGDTSRLTALAPEISRIAQETKISATEFGIFRTGVLQNIDAGQRWDRSLLETAKSLSTQLNPQFKVFAQNLRDVIGEQQRAESQAKRTAAAFDAQVRPVTAASAALRGLEGGMNIRAAERFLTTFSGMGSILQNAFPIFGALAFGEVIGRVAEKVGEIYNAWNPVHQAQEKSLAILKETIPEVKKLTDEYERLNAQARAREFGQGYSLRLEAQTAQHDATSDQRMIDLLRGQLVAAEGRVKAGTIAATPPQTVIGKGGAEFTRPGTPGGLTRDAQAAGEQIIGLQAKLEDAILQQKVDQLRSEDAKAQLGKESLDKARQRQRKIDEVSRATDSIGERSLAIADKAALQPFGRVGELVGQRLAIGRRSTQELSDLDREVRENQLGGPDTVRVPDSMFQKKRSAIVAAGASEQASIDREIVLAVRAQAENDKISRNLFENTTRETAAARTDNNLRILYEPYFKKQLLEMTESDRAEREIRDLQFSSTREDLVRQAEFLQSNVYTDSGSGSARAYGGAAGGTRAGAARRPMRIEESNTVARSLQSSSVNQGFEGRLQLANQLYQIEKKAAEEQYQDDLREYGEEKALATFRINSAKAEKDLRTQTSEAILEREKQILKLQEQQQAQYENFAKGLFGSFIEGRGRGVDEFIKSKVVGLGSTIVGNLAGSLYQQIGGGQLQVPGQTNASGTPNFLSKMLRGTPFGIDPVKAAQSLDTSKLADALSTGTNSTNTLRTSTDNLKLSIDQLENTIAYVITGGTTGSLPAGAAPAAAGISPVGFLGGIGSFMPAAASIMPGIGMLGASGSGSPSLADLPLGYSSASAAMSSLTIANAIKSAPTGMAVAQSALGSIGSLSKGGGFFGFPDFSVPTGSGSAVSASSLVGPGMQLGTGAIEAVSGFSQGGVKGGLTAAGGIASGIAGITSAMKVMGSLSAGLSAIPIVGSILGAALPLIGSLFGSNPQIRQNDINKNLENAQFYAPETISSMQDTNGSLTSYSRTGQVRSSPGVSPYPAGIQEPYYLYPTHPIIGQGTPGVNVPGTGGTYGAPIGTPVGNLNPAGGAMAMPAPAAAPTHITIQAMDSQSFGDFLVNNTWHLANGIAAAFNANGRVIRNAMTVVNGNQWN